MVRSSDLNRELSGVIAGIFGLCALAMVGLQLQDNSALKTRQRVRRALKIYPEADDGSTDYEVSFEEEDQTPLTPEEEWASENNTELWDQFQRDLGLQIEHDDVFEKQELRRRRQRGQNWNRLRENQLPGLHDAMIKEFYKRVADLQMYNEISGVDYGKPDPRESGDEESDDTETYKGFDKTAPIIRDFVDSFECTADGTNLWSSGNKLNFWYLMPQSVPLTSAKDKHVSDYDYYWKFMMKFMDKWPQTRSDIRFSIGTYHTSASFTPRGYKFRKNIPWTRLQRYYRKPRMQAARPRIFSALRTLMTFLPRYGTSTVSAGTNCVLIWMFQDVPSDINSFMEAENAEQIEELHKMCTVIPVIVTPVSDDRSDDAWRKFVANLMPGLQSKYPKDPDYSGAFYVNSFAGLMEEGLHEHIQKYLCLVQNRATCRICSDAYVEPASAAAATEGPTQAPDLMKGIEEDYEAPPEPTEKEPTEAPTTGEPTSAQPTPKTPEIDSCCGHDGYSGTPFDSELKTCCDNGQVKAYEFEGDDPCIDDNQFIFRK